MLVRPMLEYACEVWDPYVKELQLKLESVQRQALRFIYSSYRRQDSVSPLYDRASLPLLQVRRKQKRLKLFYSIINNLTLVDMHRYIDEDTSRINRNKHGQHVKERRFNKECFRYSFFVQTARDWNLLNESVVGARGRLEFASLIS